MSLQKTVLAVLAVIGLASPATLHSQGDTVALHATLEGWAEDLWLRLVDRDAAHYGRLSDQGILQRFNPTVNADYVIGLMRSRFGLLDDYAWYHQARGARLWAGSITTRDVAEGADVKVPVTLGERWSAGLDLNKVDSPEMTRALARLSFTYAAPNGRFATARGTIVPIKPSNDLALTLGWRRGTREISLTFALLDAFTNLVYQDLKVFYGFADTALAYDRQPLALRAKVDLPFARRLRMEADGAVMKPATVRAYVQSAPDSGFRQDESYGFATTLVEWQATPAVTAGLYGTYVRARLARTPLLNGRAVDRFGLTEEEYHVGGLVLARPSSRFLLEGWMERNWRPQTELFPTGAAPNVDYLDRAWTGQATVWYRAPGGFIADLAFDMDLREVVRGEGQVLHTNEGSLGRHN